MTTHLFAPEGCPNYPHGHRGQPTPKGTCPLCGRNSRVFLFGERLAQATVIAATIVSTGLMFWLFWSVGTWIASW